MIAGITIRSRAIAALLLLAACQSRATQESNAGPPSPGARAGAEGATPVDLRTPPSDAERSASGLVSKVLVKGQGSEHPHVWDRVAIHYTGWGSDGSVFNSSRAAAAPGSDPQPLTIQPAAAMPGLSEGIELMTPGEKRRMWIPARLADGEPRGPAGPLVFDVELYSIERTQGPPPAPPDVAAVPADAEKSASGLASQRLSEGTGTVHPKPTDLVQVHFTGWTTAGKPFGSSISRGEPAVISLATTQVKGWAEGVPLMVRGEKRRFWIPQELAYQGRAGMPEGVLVFDIELLDIVTPQAPRDLTKIPKDGVKTALGIVSKVLRQGTGNTHPSATDTVRIHYSGWTSDGQLFDSSITRGEAAELPMSQVIPGWLEPLQQMVVGERRRVWVPEGTAFQDTPTAPKGLLVFDLELLRILP